MDELPASAPFPAAPDSDPERAIAHRKRLLALRAEREAARSFPADAPVLGLQPSLPKGLRRVAARNAVEPDKG